MKHKTFLAFILLSLIPFLVQAETHVSDSNRPFIVGGDEAARGAWPFIAVLYTKGSAYIDGQFCGASLIADKWVLTAAHCVADESAGNIAVALGVHTLSTDTGEEINVAHIIPHPSYDTSTNDYDIALLELEQSSSYQSVSLAADNYVLNGKIGTAIGWGITDPNNEFSSADALQQVSLPIVSNTTCESAFDAGEITAQMLCAGYTQGGKDSCQGDSGGPLVVSDNGTWRLAGAVSWGNGCAEAGSYGVYARVSKFLSWIEGYTGDLTPTPPPPPTDSSMYGLWNGYLSMTNVLEVENFNNTDTPVNIYIYSGSGSHAATISETIAARSKRDFLLANYAGFATDAYGVLRVDGSVRGRVFYYRPLGQGFSSFDFGFGVELSKASTGTSYVSFNSFQPSSHLLDVGNVVANWLSVVNVGSASAPFTVNKYGVDGDLISSSTKSISSLARVDLEGGHIVPGPQNVGLLEVVPDSAETKYLAQLMRYGYGRAGDFDFAFPLIATTGKGQIYAPISSMAGIQNWLEVLNVSDSSANVEVKFYDQDGAEVTSYSEMIPARGQKHFNASEALGANAVGHAVITAGTAVLAAQSMYYFRDSSDGGIQTMYGSQARTSSSNALSGSYNLFLGMFNYLKLVNVTASSTEVDVTLISSFSAGSSHTYTLPAHGSLDLGLHEASVFGTIPDSYGAVRVEPGSSGALITEVLRMKSGSEGAFEFVAPTGFE